MSKNKQMLSETITTVGRERPTTGPASLVQGVYGARGNLELLACDARDGLWVFWFNSDLASDPLETPDVPPGAWSGGLAFAQGARYRQAQILQSTLGPDHLEVLALREDGVLESWYWSPGPGFQRRAGHIADAVRRFAAAHDAGRLTLTLSGEDGEWAMASGAEGYPDRVWAAADCGPGLDDGTESIALLIASGVSEDDIEPGSARASRTGRRGGTTELTWRDRDGALRHLGASAPAF
jgi:hypothetical protein